MVKDEEKIYTPFHTVYENGRRVKKHTDHAVMTIEMNWVCEASKPKMKKVMTTKSYERFKEMINKERYPKLYHHMKQSQNGNKLS